MQIGLMMDLANERSLLFNLLLRTSQRNFLSLNQLSFSNFAAKTNFIELASRVGCLTNETLPLGRQTFYCQLASLFSSLPDAPNGLCIINVSSNERFE